MYGNVHDSFPFQSANIGQMFHPGGAGYFVPTAMAQAGPRGYLPTGVLPAAANAMRATPRWNTMAGVGAPRAQTALASATGGFMQAGYPQAASTMAARARVPTAGGAGVRPQTGGVTGAQMARPITGSTAQVMQQARMAGKAAFSYFIWSEEDPILFAV